jgi:hypothetical protein
MFDFEKHSKREITMSIGKTNAMAFITTLPFIIILAMPFFLFGDQLIIDRFFMFLWE